jgi:glutaredoxin
VTAPLTLYGQNGCHLCDDARAVVQRVAADEGLAFDEVDISTDERLVRAYLERIPVLTIDGAVAFELFVDEAELRQRLAGGPTRNVSPEMRDPGVARQGRREAE